MTLIIASIALAFALYFTACAAIRLTGELVLRKHLSHTTMHTILAAAFWGMFYYCTHLG